MGPSQKISIETQTRSYSAMNLLKGANEISGCGSQGPSDNLLSRL